MMNEIVRTRNTLTSYFDDKGDRSIYDFKRDAIQNSLYGVDIDPSAVEIAKLRLWLSLMVDEEDIKQIKPLPNLDYKIMQGNSLLEEFEGVKLFDDRLLNSYVPANDNQIKKLEAREKEIQKNLMTYYQKNPLWMKSQKTERPTELYQLESELKRVQLSMKDEKGVRFQIKDLSQNALFGEEHKARKIWEELQSLQKKFFETTQKKEKDELKKQIQKLEWELIETTLREENKESSLKKLEQYKRANIKPFFLWKLNFSEVFQEKGGFDIVIGNPPYLSSKNIENDIKPEYERIYKTPMAHYDIYVIFFEQGLNLLKKNGLLTYITSNKFFSQKYGDNLREMLLKKSILEIINFNFNIFQATVDTAITMVCKNDIFTDHKIKLLDVSSSDFKGKADEDLHLLLHDEKRLLIPQSFIGELPDAYFRFDISMSDIDIYRKLFYDSSKLSELCLVIYGIVLHNAEKNVKKDKFIFSNYQNNYKPYTEGKFIDRWFVKKLMYLDYKPLIHREPRYPELFENVKLIGKRIIGRKGFSFLFDEQSIYVDNTLYIILPYHLLPRNKYGQLSNVLTDERIDLSKKIELKFILALINSNLYKWLFQKFYSFGLDVYPIHLKSLPIKTIRDIEQKPFIEIVNKILGTTKSDDYVTNSEKQAKVKDYEKQIDQMIYKLYGLKDEEKKIVENSVKK
jgi:hypothetical protein